MLLRSFNPICRISNRALALGHERCKLGDRGHYEVLLPTLFKYFKLKISDFGGMANIYTKADPDFSIRIIRMMNAQTNVPTVIVLHIRKKAWHCLI